MADKQEPLTLLLLPSDMLAALERLRACAATVAAAGGHPSEIALSELKQAVDNANSESVVYQRHVPALRATLEQLRNNAAAAQTRSIVKTVFHNEKGDIVKVIEQPYAGGAVR